MEGLAELEAQLSASPAFFQDGQVALDVGARLLSSAEIGQIQALLARRQVALRMLISSNDGTQAVAHDLGLEVETGQTLSPRPDAASPPSPPMLEPLTMAAPPADAMLARRTLRSGQRLNHQHAIVVIGDVNPGAEVIAGGDIVVWGHARGLLHAGAYGDEEAVVCALDLSPMQLRIAGHIALSPEERQGIAVPEMASVRDGQIVAVPWHAGGTVR
jgi:septum site-determining protein MinC